MNFLDILKIIILVIIISVVLFFTAKDDLERHDMDIFKLIEDDKDNDDDYN